jgi:NAD(P)-dependent dehydrogenase (short-subunit alcohol dehydrogenase family)
MTALPASYQPAAGVLADRVVLVTGAGDGLGRACALDCARHGATVVLLGRTVAKLEKTYDSIKAAGGAEPAIYPLNLAGATWSDYEQLAETLQREFGRLDGLAHCAAHFKSFAPLATVEPAEWLESLQVNVTAPFALTRHCLPLLEAAAAAAPGGTGSASVAFVSDACGRTGKAYAGPYGVSKFAVEGLMQTWAQELEGVRIRLNSLDPGPMDTALRRKGFAEAVRGPSPEAAARALLWLLGPDSRPATGTALSLRA